MANGYKYDTIGNYFFFVSRKTSSFTLDLAAHDFIQGYDFSWSTVFTLAVEPKRMLFLPGNVCKTEKKYD